MITYILEKEERLRELLGNHLLQLFVKGGGIKFVPPQITASEEFIAVFQKDKSYTEMHIKLEETLHTIQKSTDIKMTINLGKYPKIDFQKFNCAIENPYNQALLGIEVLYHSIDNIASQELLYFKGLIFHFSTEKKLLIYCEDSPKSFTISMDDNLIYDELVYNSTKKKLW